MAKAKFDIRRKNQRLAMAKIFHLVLITKIPTSTMKELNKLQKEFI